MQVVKDEVLVRLDLGVGLGDAQINSGGVNLRLRLRGHLVVILRQVEVAAESVDRLLSATFLVVEQTKFQIGVSLGLLHALVFVGQVAELFEVVDGGVDVTVFGM